jgi:hypothetical protein
LSTPCSKLSSRHFCVVNQREREGERSRETRWAPHTSAYLAAFVPLLHLAVLLAIGVVLPGRLDVAVRMVLPHGCGTQTHTHMRDDQRLRALLYSMMVAPHR